jgi:hypothetical protein
MTGFVVNRSVDLQAYRVLGRQEPVFARLVKLYGRPSPFEWHDGGRTGASLFAAMVLHIVGQQISAVVGFRVYDRLAVACGGIPTPDVLLRIGEQRLRAARLSGAKTTYVLALAKAPSPRRHRHRGDDRNGRRWHRHRTDRDPRESACGRHRRFSFTTCAAPTSSRAAIWVSVALWRPDGA